MGKATGKSVYADDLAFPGMLYGRFDRSRATIPLAATAACARSGGTSTPQASQSSTARDIPGKNVVALIEDDQPCLVGERVRHFAEPILLLAHADRERLLAPTCEIDYRAAASVLRSRARPTIVFKTLTDPEGRSDAQDRAMADVVVEGDLRARGARSTLYIEA